MSDYFVKFPLYQLLLIYLPKDIGTIGTKLKDLIYIKNVMFESKDFLMDIENN